MTLQINTPTGQRALTTDEQTEVRDGIGAQSAAQTTAAAAAAVAAHVASPAAHAGLMTPAQAEKLNDLPTAATLATDQAAQDLAISGKADASHTHTPAAIGAATAAQGAKADTALQPGVLPVGTTLPAAQISDATVPGRALLTAADAAAQRTALSLGNVSNTADADKPVSTAQALAIAAATTADAIADTLEAAATGAPADLARIQASVSGDAKAHTPVVLASIGDSIGAYARQAVATSDRRFNFHGYLGWVRRICGSRASLPIANIFNIGGKTLEEVRTQQLAAAAASNADYVIVHAGTNNSNDITNTTYAEDVADYTEIINTLIASGKGVIFIPVRIRGSAFPISAAMRNKLAQLAIWARGYAAGRRVLVVDVNPAFIDYSSTVGNGATILLPDGTHDGPNGSAVMGRVVADSILRNIVRCDAQEVNGRWDYRPSGMQADIQNGNQIPNPIMLGNTGTLSGGATGVVAANYRVRVAGPLGSGTVVASKTALPGYINRERQTITLGGTWTSGTQVAIDIDPDQVAVVGDVMQLKSRTQLVIASGGVSMFGVQYRMFDAAIADTGQSWDGYSDSSWQTQIGHLDIAQDTGPLYFETDPTLVPAGTTGHKPTLWIQPKAGVNSIVVHVDWMSLREVP